MSEGERKPWDELEELLDRSAADEVSTFLGELGPGEAVRVLDRLDQEHRDLVLEILDVEAAAELLEQLPEVQGSDLLEKAQPATAAAILEELTSDDQADLIAQLEPESVNSILSEMDPEVAASTRELASYPSETAGGLMAREFFAYPEDATVSEVVVDLRRRADEVEEYGGHYVYVVGSAGQLRGVLRLHELLLTRGARPVRELMIVNPVAVSVTAPLDELADLLEVRAFLSLPVLEEDGRLVGTVHRAQVDEAWEERAESSRLKAQGIVGGDELRSMPLLLRSRRRLSWLSVNIVLNVCAASVITVYQDTLSSVIALAVFLPIISDMSGCSGNQAVAVSMRELTLGVVKPMDFFYVWRKELAVGLINGAALGGLLAATAWLWKGSPVLGLVVGVALAINTLVAVSIGGAVPLILKRFGLDPALASGPILTTLTDMCGFFLILSLASAALPWLLPT